MCGYNAALSALRRIDPARDLSDTPEPESFELTSPSVPLARR